MKFKFFIVIFIMCSNITTMVAYDYMFITPKQCLGDNNYFINNYISNVISSPELVAIIFNSNYSDTINDVTYGEIEFQSIMKYEGDNIGRANAWIYIFRSKDNPIDYVVASAVGLVDNFQIYVFYYYDFNIEEAIPSICKFSLNTSIDINEIMESDIESDTFVKQLADNTDYMAKLSNTQLIKNHIIGLYSVDEPQYGMEANKMYWISILETIDSTYVCYTDYNVTSNFACNSYSGIEEDNNISLKINVFPNPTDKLINFDVPIDQVLNNLELFDINGNLLCKFNTDITTLDLSGYNTGEYYLCFTLNNTKYYRSIILSK